MMLGTVAILLSCASLITPSTGDAFLSLKFLTFVNPRGKGANGHCCDGKLFVCFSKCDHSFTICLDHADGSPSSIYQCSYGKVVSGEITDANQITFGSRIGSIDNPIVWRLNELPGRVRLKIDIVDIDRHNRNDDVDYLQTILSLVPSTDQTKTQFYLRNRISLTMETQVYCGQNYYGPSCSNFCLPRNDDLGHYTCNKQDGSKICLTGWTGSSCNLNEDNCIGNKCQNGAICKDLINSYECVCLAGFTGHLCEHDIDECINQDTCIHGVCINKPGSFTCNCHTGYSGETCSTNIDECQSSPCDNAATCRDGIGDFTCLCPVGFTGKLCDEDVNECQFNSCTNNGTCVNLSGGHRCDCLSGYQGHDCSLDIDECNHSPCQNEGTCINFPGGYNCQCSMGFEGVDCRIDIDECENSTTTCQNNGLCVNTPGSYVCQCESGYTGQSCEININECLSQPCQHGSTCHDLTGSYVCECLQGYTGQNCEENIDECLDTICKNGGTCRDINGSFECACSEYWEGRVCEKNVNECLSDPCRNGGQCENIQEGFMCICPTEFTGTLCEADMNECELDKTCRNNATCTNTFGNFTCDCLEGWTGRYCEDDINECERGHCENSGTCVNMLGGFYCECLINWQGSICQDDVDECAAELSLCRNNATCHNLLGAFHCTCAEGWTGPLCGEDINECLQSPEICETIGNSTNIGFSENSHTFCVNTAPGYLCKCQNGWTGPICNEDINECLQSPDICNVVNNSTGTENSTDYHKLCINTQPGHLCTCQEGWTGEQCDEDINECLENPLLCSLLNNSNTNTNNTLLADIIYDNRRVCVNTQPGYVCVCSEGWSGENCEFNVSTATPTHKNTVPYKNDTMAVYDNTTLISSDPSSSYIKSITEGSSTVVNKETSMNVEMTSRITEVTTEGDSQAYTIDPESNLKETTVNVEEINFIEHNNVTRRHKDLSMPLYLACEIKPDMDWKINNGLNQMFLDTHLFQGKDLKVNHRSLAETSETGEAITSIYPTVAVNGRTLSNEMMTSILNKMSQKINDYLPCPLFLDDVQEKMDMTAASLKSTSRDWYAGLITACGVLVVVVIIVIIVKTRRGMKTWCLNMFQKEKNTLSVMNPVYVPASGIQENEDEDSDFKHIWGQNQNISSSVTKNDEPDWKAAF